MKKIMLVTFILASIIYINSKEARDYMTIVMKSFTDMRVLCTLTFIILMCIFIATAFVYLGTLISNKWRKL